MGTRSVGLLAAANYSPYSPESSEPQCKKRCLRFPSDLSSEDPSLVSDSGFGDLSTGTGFGVQDGDLEVGSFFGVGESIFLLLSLIGWVGEGRRWLWENLKFSPELLHVEDSRYFQCISAAIYYNRKFKVVNFQSQHSNF